MSRTVLIIDGQVFQTDARHRGMGRYSESLIKSLIATSHYSKIRIMINKNLHVNNVKVGDLKKMFVGADLVSLDLSDTSKEKIEVANRHNKKEIDNYIASISSRYDTIDYLIPSLFQEPVVSVFPDGVKKILVFYDLIPYLYYNRYQSLMQFDNYLKRFSLIFEADKILAISQAVRDDLILYLGVPDKRVVSIDGAAIKANEPPVKPVGLEVPDKYILMPTSDDPRKNNLRAVLGFEEFRAVQTQDYKLIITSKIHKSERSKLELFSENIIFTGNIKEAELDWLYDQCQAVLFVSESEGLGLPVLEAVLAGKRVICSSLNVFREISEDAFYYCEHDNQHSIADAIMRALATEDRHIPTQKYKAISKHYSWEQVAKRSIKAIGSTKVREVRNRKKIAMFIPAPDGLSAVGKVVAEGFPALGERFDVDYYAERVSGHGSTRPNYLQYVANYYDAQSFSVEKYKQYDAVFYHIGNSDYHIESIRNSLYLPGYVILHDTNIGEAYRVMYERGIISKDRKNLEDTITNESHVKTSSYISSVVNNQLGVLTHSHYASAAVHEVLVDRKTPRVTVNLATQCIPTRRFRDNSNLTVGLAGIIADIKGIKVIEALASNDEFANCNFRLFGYNYASEETIKRLNAYSNITVSTNLTDFDFHNSMSKLDVFVNYRMKYQGETSLSTLEAMRQGVVVIVRNVGWYAELPDDVVVKVESEEQVADALLDLRSNPDKLAEISQKTKQYIQEMHTNKQYAEGLERLLDTASKSGKIISDEIRLGKIKSAPQLVKLYQQIQTKEGMSSENLD